MHDVQRYFCVLVLRTAAIFQEFHAQKQSGRTPTDIDLHARLGPIRVTTGLGKREKKVASGCYPAYVRDIQLGPVNSYPFVVIETSEGEWAAQIPPLEKDGSVIVAVKLLLEGVEATGLKDSTKALLHSHDLWQIGRLLCQTFEDLQQKFGAEVAEEVRREVENQQLSLGLDLSGWL